MERPMICEFCAKVVHFGTDEELEHSLPDGRRFTSNPLVSNDDGPDCANTPAGRKAGHKERH